MAGFHPSTVFLIPIAAVSFCLSIFLMPVAGNWPREEFIEVSLPRNECKIPCRANLYLRFNASKGLLEMRVDTLDVQSNEEMVRAVRDIVGGSTIPVGIDAHEQVPWAQVRRIIKILKENGIRRIDLLGHGGF
ncbi:MAG TPA: biopolymer transporter ExbD [Planctomycetota bacterium]|nr:biopolymer transporter ExbD [Planctomycetota bacterium]